MNYRAQARGLARRGVSTLRRVRRAPSAIRHRLDIRRQRPRWAAATAEGAELHTFLGDVDDGQWLWMHTAGRRTDPVIARLLPDLPSDELQLRFTGSADDSTLTEGWSAYRLFRDLYGQYVRPVTSGTRVLDFGCGWGRMTRFFLKDVARANIVGLDINGVVLAECRRAMPGVRFEQIDVMPPVDLPDASADLVYAYSVFSHLSRAAHDRWLAEFERLIAPGGLLVATTWPRTFIEYCHRLRTDPALAGLPDSHLVSARAFPDTTEALRVYDAAEFCFSHRGGGDPPDFGETCISEAFARSYWTRHFEIAEYIDDRDRCPQNVIVARRR